jgi:DNA-binding MarR family transcriptional regulator
MVGIYHHVWGLKGVDETTKLEEAKKLASLIPTLMRQIFTLGDDLAVDLPLAQIRVCMILREGSRPMSALSQELSVSLSAMTQIADRLERAKLVNRVPDPSDRRIRCLQLTQQGEKIMQRHENSRIQNILAVLNYLSPGARVEILTALEMLMQASIKAKTEAAANGSRHAGPHHRQAKLFIPKVIS